MPTQMPLKKLQKQLLQLSPSAFMKQHWQKKPRWIAGAYPAPWEWLTPKRIKTLATHPEAQVRLIQKTAKKWQVHYGPLRPIDFKTLPQKNWTVLIQDLQHWYPEADDLLGLFRFIPYARTDDLMVSYAVPGGSVGPHYDSYDVFLLQGFGQRHWEIAQYYDNTLQNHSEIKLISPFPAEQSRTLSPGDMLYLPPYWAHHGVAVTECLTCSIGFRAPSYQEWGDVFLNHLMDQLTLTGDYTDPELSATNNPARLPQSLIKKVHQKIQELLWNQSDVIECIGLTLSEPKPHVIFIPPKKPLNLKSFQKILQHQRLQLHPASQMLYYGSHVFWNGESHEFKTNHLTLPKTLANNRKLAPCLIEEPHLSWLFEGYQAGWCSVT